ncbi:conserved hypothetical protein [Theileria orientalis strain Shintoku]|uniref:Uncharacterized protein n=1 Tax=Theileria orientalis strain Shintoku TaxID=869250 RepID=J4C8H5_THEOR|nr:conserved hypothetical protein [Theileria orientalis strain Shintoku]BAM40798.1 conserved hypothetical protein [Theileria orientalis strain Shintoku]|eukprot:XP_009691099.1 conserved hypothetical protein [Theileria orientalis strain Shintoku]
MSSQDRNLSMSFDFFKKRRKTRHSRSGYGSSPLSPASLSESFLSGSQNGRVTSSVTRRGTFRGLLSDSSTPASQHSSTHSSTQNDEFSDFVPDLPDVDVDLCKPFNYISWARDQMVFGNDKIVSMTNLEELFQSQLKELENTIKNSYGVEKSVASVIYSRMKESYRCYSYLLENSSQYCHLSSVYLNSYVFLRPLNLTNFSFATGDISSVSEVDRLINSVNVDGSIISGPVFVHESLMSHFEKKCEYLPSKLCSGYDFKNMCIEFDYLPNLISRVIHERAVRQLIIIKSNVDISLINLLLTEGYNVYNLKSGEKCWLPIYICDKLSHDGLISAELPIYLTMNKKIYIPNLSDRIEIYNYISKIAGIVEDIRYSRMKKIRAFLENLPISENIIQLNNFQFSETYFINQFLCGYCSFYDRNRKLSGLFWAQTDGLIRDLENNLLDSITKPIL